VAHLFILVSGENPTLPFSEVKAILEAEEFKYQILEALTQILRIEAEPRCIKALVSRSAMARICGTEIFNCKADIGEILETIEEAELAPFIGEGESFVVRVKRVRMSSSEINTWTLEKVIGDFLFNKLKVKVDLKAPKNTFFGIVTDDRFIFGLKIAEIKHGEFLKRGPRRKAFFHPSAMPAKLARCMVNLAQPRMGDLVLDPFCGTGSFLVEASLIGCNVLGLDVKRYMVRGSLRNLTLYGIKPESIVVADARFIPLDQASVDCVVTDPPYGTSATTLKVAPRDLIESFLSTVGDVVKKRGRICLAAPKTFKVSEIVERMGFKHLESHFIYVHRSLTREIAVFKCG